MCTLSHYLQGLIDFRWLAGFQPSTVPSNNRTQVIINYLENKLLLISINFTPKTSHSCLKKWYEFLCFPGMSFWFPPKNHSLEGSFRIQKKYTPLGRNPTSPLKLFQNTWLPSRWAQKTKPINGVKWDPYISRVTTPFSRKIRPSSWWMLMVSTQLKNMLVELDHFPR